MFCCTLLYVHSCIAIILMGKRELVALLNLSSWCLVMVEWPFLAVPWGCLWFVIVVFPDHTHYFFSTLTVKNWFLFVTVAFLCLHLNIHSPKYIQILTAIPLHSPIAPLARM